MRLINAKISGFRRFQNTGINLDGRLIAVVGPNESGKTSLLAALSRLEDGEPIARRDLTRGTSPAAEHTVIEARYLLSEEDRDLVKELGGTGEPRWYIIGKSASGELYHYEDPRVSRDRSARSQALERIEVTLANQRLRSLLSVAYASDHSAEEEPPDDISLREKLTHIREAIDTEDESLSEELVEEIEDLLGPLEVCREAAAKSNQRSVELVSEALAILLESEQEHPADLLVDELDNRRPRFLLITQEDSHLASEYPIHVLGNPPAALSNLLTLAELSLSELQQALQSEDHGRRAALEERANLNLNEKFSAAWGQSDVFVHLKLEPEVIRILVRAAETYTAMPERSDGLRAFVALYALTARRSQAVRPILLIDEVEAHLHYEAQADLIRAFEAQQAAQQIIYTTHSAGCLPNDLGAGVRSISPIHLADGRDTNRSVINNAYWTERGIGGTGVSPLVIAVSAGLLALTPARLALVTETLSEAMLLPTLLREVTGRDQLAFQVVPGLVRISRDQMKELDPEALRLVYLVGGDGAGDENRQKILDAGFLASEIVQLPKNMVIEDLLQAELYLAAVNEELRRSHGDAHQLDQKAVPARNRPAALEAWCQDHKIASPTRAKIAAHVLAQVEDKRLVAPSQSRHLTKVFEEVSRILGLA